MMKALTVVYAVEMHLYKQSIPGWELEVPVVRLAEVVTFEDGTGR